MAKINMQKGSIFTEGYGIIAKRVMIDKDISTTAKAIYRLFCTYGDASIGDKAYPSIRYICDVMDIHKDTFYKHLQQLIDKDYIRTARLKGIPDKYVIYKHALKNALLPSITVIGMNIGWLFGGLIVVEKLFGYPGIGYLLVMGLQSRDIPLVEVIMLFIVTIYLLANFITDLSYSILDPRVEITKAE